MDDRVTYGSMMAITNDVELEQAVEVISNLRRAVEALRRDVPNERNFAVVVKDPLNEICRLEAEVNAYFDTKDFAEFLAFLKETSAIVQTWPQWKLDAFRVPRRVVKE